MRTEDQELVTRDPDFDEWYVIDRRPEAIEAAKRKWAELEKLRLQVNEIQGLVKNNGHCLRTSSDAKRLQKKCDEQAELHSRLTPMQRSLALLKVEFRSCGVIRLTHMERAFLEEAEKYLAAEAYHEIKRRAVECIKRRLGATPRMADYRKFKTKREVEGSLTRALVTSAKLHQEITSLDKRLKTAIGGLRSVAYGDAQTWPNCSAREVAKQALLDCGGEKDADHARTRDSV